MADERPVFLGASEYLPAAAPDHLLGAEARELLGRSVPRDDPQLLVEDEESVSGVECVSDDVRLP